MSTAPAAAATARCPAAPRAPRAPRTPGTSPTAGTSGGRDDGFSLIEVVASLLIVAVVMAGALNLLVRSLTEARIYAQRQTAMTVADNHMESVRNIAPSTLLNGRTQTAVTALWADPGMVSTTGTAKAWDSAAASNTLLVPTVQYVYVTDSGDATTPSTTTTTRLTGASRPASSTEYTVRTFIDVCNVQSTAGSSSATVTCSATATTTTTAMYRVVVNVTWTPGRGRTCSTASGLCGYVLTSYVDISSDPTFTDAG